MPDKLLCSGSLRITQQNAGLVEEASAAAQAMSDQAQTLQEAVAIFRIAGTGPSASRVVTQRSEPRRLAPRVALTKSNTTPVLTREGNTAVAGDASAADWQTF